MTEATFGRNLLGARQFYLAVWRWHFYAGLLVLPLLGLLALSGLLMLIHKPLDALLHAELHEAQPRPPALTPNAQVDRVRARFPDARVVAYLPAAAADRSTRVVIARPGSAQASDAPGGHAPEATLTVFVDPYRGTVLGVQDPATTLYAWAKALHGTLLLGAFGDAVIEVLAGLAVLLVGNGMYLAWPRAGERWRRRLLPRLGSGHRQDWRDLHAGLGAWLAVPLLFFLISGLTWTGFWGGRLVQAWSSIPAAELDAPAAEHDHASRNRAPRNEVPWALEQTPLPRAGAGHGAAAVVALPVNLDSVVAFARGAGFERFRVHLPRDGSDPWTVSASTMSGDVQDPRRERTVHIDGSSGRVLADLEFADYPFMGKAMAAVLPPPAGVWCRPRRRGTCLPGRPSSS